MLDNGDISTILSHPHIFNATNWVKYSSEVMSDIFNPDTVKSVSEVRFINGEMSVIPSHHDISKLVSVINDDNGEMSLILLQNVRFKLCNVVKPPQCRKILDICTGEIQTSENNT